MREDIRFQQLKNGLAVRLYQLTSGKYSISLWDTDEDRNAISIQCADLSQAERIFSAQLADCQRYE